MSNITDSTSAAAVSKISITCDPPKLVPAAGPAAVEPLTSRKASFIENLCPTGQQQAAAVRRNSHGSAPPPKPVKESVLYQSSSLQLSEYVFVDASGEQKVAQVIHKRFNASNRTDIVATPPVQNGGKFGNSLFPPQSLTVANNATSSNDHSSDPEGIMSIAILKRHILCDCLILTKKYRPSLKSYVLEFPARIIEQSARSRTNSDERLDAISSTHTNATATPTATPTHDKSSNHRGEDSRSDEEEEEAAIIGDAAVKDVEDNTGYRSTQVNYVSPETAIDPELCDNKLKIVSLVIDGDDPIRNNFLAPTPTSTSSLSLDDDAGRDGTGTGPGAETAGSKHVCSNSCIDDVEVIPLPINGLLDRLNEYSRRGTIVDSRVYAFAIGLKKGEKMAAAAFSGNNEEIEMTP